MKYWITINEPSAICHGYSGRLAAPGMAFDAFGYYAVASNILKAHARVYRLYERQYRASQKGFLIQMIRCTYSIEIQISFILISGNISICIDVIFYQPKTGSDEDLQAAERAWVFYVSMKM